MHKLKILKTSFATKLLSLYSLLLLFYYYIIFSIGRGLSTLSMAQISDFYSERTYLPALALISVVSIFRMKKFSFAFTLFFYGIIWIKSVHLAVTDVDKFTLITLFAVSGSMILNLIILNGELNKACFNPRFSLRDIENVLSIPVSIEAKDSNGNFSEIGTITNFDSSSCYIKSGKSDFDSRALLFKTPDFSAEISGRVVSRYGNSIGLNVNKNPKYIKEWNRVYNYLSGRGYGIY